MNWDQIEGNWKQLKGNIHQQWVKLTDSDLQLMEGKREVLAGKIQETYGITKDEAEKQVDDWQNSQANSIEDEENVQLDNKENTKQASKFGYDDNIQNKYDNTPPSMMSGVNDEVSDISDDSQGPGDGAGIPGTSESDEMDDSGKPSPNPMPDDLDEPTHADKEPTPHQDKSLDQT